MNLGMMTWSAILLLCPPIYGQATFSGGRYSGTATYQDQAQGTIGTGENFYCLAGVGELTEGTPTWGSVDGVAQLPTRCMNTAMASTPSGTHMAGGTATTYTPADTAALNVALSTLQCGDTIVLTAGSTYTGTISMPAPACDSGHWIIVKSSGSSDPTFPAAGIRATPCIAGISNDAVNGHNSPGYPDYVCPSYPAILSAKIAVGTANQPALTFVTGANHYRFIGGELTKVPETKLGAGIVELSPDSVTMGANHIIFDRSIVHGQPWVLLSSKNTETQVAVKAKNSQWIAVVNSWVYDTYCNSGCVDSQAFGAGTGLFQDGPFKLYNNVLASSGEAWLFGGGGQGAATPNTKDFEARSNHVLKNLGWMVPIESCPVYNAVIPKNLGEFKNMTFALVEGNYFENSWQGCQSDQVGYALLLNPGNQNNHQAMSVNFDGTNVVVAADSNSFSHHNGSPADAANCPPGGCVLEISDTTRSGVDQNFDYIFCNGTNGCDQSGVDLVTHARLTSVVPAGTGIGVNACVPGDCPTCKVQNITYRYNEIFNTTNAFQINSGLSSHCHDEGAGLDHVTIHDNLEHGLSVEMSNGSDPYQMSVCTTISSNTKRSISAIGIFHNTCAVETGNGGGFGGLGHQVDHTNVESFTGFNIHDNVSPAPWHISRSTGSIVTKGVGGQSGLANTYQTDACQQYYPAEAPGGIVVAGALSNFTFSPSLALYMVTVNGQYSSLASSPNPTSTSFTLQTAASAGDDITVRDLNNCPWTFTGNLLGTSLAGSGSTDDPYPASNNTNCGVSGTASCILDDTAFTNLFSSYGTGRTGNFGLTSPTYLNSATDAASRGATGKSPGVDLTVLTQLTQGMHGTTFYPVLTITTGALPGAVVGTAYQASLQASTGASPHKGWWVETDPTQCGGNCGSFPSSAGIIIGRGGVVNGPFIVGTVSRASNVSSFTPQQTIVAGTWQVGQTIVMTGFLNGTGSQANDGSFNGTCVISAVNGNSFSCPQTGVDVAGHSPKDASLVSFAPVSSGSFSFWVGARDGAFQIARGPVTLTIGSQGAQRIELNWDASLSSGENGGSSYKMYRWTTPGSYGPSATGVSGTHIYGRQRTTTWSWHSIRNQLQELSQLMEPR
ncbi:MAG: hypothetical protein DMG80_02885 [Acidobacteria bacterium]|nr:MAG: hypothetical protein DMG80_02885 [Acidobacteriota bacterium]